MPFVYPVMIETTLKHDMQPYVEYLTKSQWLVSVHAADPHATSFVWFGCIQMQPLMVAGSVGCHVMWRTYIGEPLSEYAGWCALLCTCVMHSS